ncbi:MAG: hypothetical protein VB934_23250 [Polyangiaceae bacterium]
MVVKIVSAIALAAVLFPVAATAQLQPPPPPTGGPPPPPSAVAPASSAPAAGGLTAPAPLPSGDLGQPVAARQLQEAEDEDSGRGLSWFYLDAEGGYQFVSLETFDVDVSNLTAGFIKDEASGAFVGAGLGLRLVFLTIGPRARVGFFQDWQLYSIGGQMGFRFPLGRIEPHASIGAGYSALGNVAGALQGLENSVRIRGFDVRASGGLDLFPTTWLSVGGGVSWEFLALTRPGVSIDDLNAQPTADLSAAQEQVLAAEGSGYGTAITVSGRLGFHL